jgi:hypothetical protein
LNKGVNPEGGLFPDRGLEAEPSGAFVLQPNAKRVALNRSGSGYFICPDLVRQGNAFSNPENGKPGMGPGQRGGSQFSIFPLTTREKLWH